MSGYGSGLGSGGAYDKPAALHANAMLWTVAIEHLETDVSS